MLYLGDRNTEDPITWKKIGVCSPNPCIWGEGGHTVPEEFLFSGTQEFRLKLHQQLDLDTDKQTVSKHHINPLLLPACFTFFAVVLGEQTFLWAAEKKSNLLFFPNIVPSFEDTATPLLELVSMQL